MQISRMLPFWCSISHAHASKAQRFSRWLVSCSARFLFLSVDVTFSGAPPLVFFVAVHQNFLLSTLFDSKPSSQPQLRGLGCSTASFAVVVLNLNSSIFDPLPDSLMS